MATVSGRGVALIVGAFAVFGALPAQPAVISEKTVLIIMTIRMA